MPQLTLVAHYGPKKSPRQAPFMAYARACQQAVARSLLNERFTPYQEAQIHGTLIGLEETAGHPGAGPDIHYNANLWEQSGELRAMDLDCALDLARALPPLTIRFGGFDPQDKVIESRGRSAYARSFGIDWRTGKVVIMGWAHERGDFSGYTKFWAIRQAFGLQCWVHHKYENDSDFFVTIGELTGLERLDGGSLTQLRSAGERVAESIRARIAAPRRAVDLPLCADDLSVVCYTDERLAPATSKAFPVTDPSVDAVTLWRALCV